MVREKIKKFKREFRIQTTTALLAALAFIIALVWRDFISDSIDHIVAILGVTENLYLYKLFSALLVTFLAILAIMLISKFKVEENIEENPQKPKKK